MLITFSNRAKDSHFSVIRGKSVWPNTNKTWKIINLDYLELWV